ncbi:transglycosylase SLT domain-containing protein [Idiomarina tyrosinivorans]|nr:transglycosylase SLT domain-containing protein [Idiomarina tyrosinivorans]
MFYRQAKFTQAVSLVIAMLVSVAVGAQQLTLEQQRELFVKAEYAAKRGRLDEYQLLLEKLQDYPLKPYLELERLQQVGYLANEDRVLAFLKQYEGTPLDWQLRGQWLDYLQEQDLYRRFARDFRYPGTDNHQCYFIDAKRRMNAMTDDEFIKRVDAIWNAGYSLPDSCNPILEQWTDMGARTPEKVWQRLRLAAEGGDATLLPYLTRLLPDDQRYLGELYRILRRYPQRVSQSTQFPAFFPHKEATIAAYALQREVWDDPERAITAYHRIVQRLPFSAEQNQQVVNEFAVALSLKNHPAAEAWQQKAGNTALTERLLQWRLAFYLRNQDFSGLLQVIDQFPNAIQQGNQWRYWRARAYEETGNALQAQKLYQDLANERHYYGFLAAAKIGQPVNLERQPLDVSVQRMEAVRSRPAARRAYEFLQLERWVDARREWHELLSHLSADEQLAAAALASEWGWHDQAIWGVAQVGHFDAVQLRFPLAYLEQIEQSAGEAGIDPFWAIAVTRRESAFRSDAYSSAGARGLMQILPSTAERVLNRQLGWQELHQPATNIAIGTAYLGQLNKRVNNNWVLATAAYNAGYYRVLDWLPTKPMPADCWIETIPYHETRDYVKAVLAYQQIYRMLVDKHDNLFQQVATMTIEPAEEDN